VRSETYVGLVVDVRGDVAEVSVRIGGGGRADCSACGVTRGCCSGGPIAVRKFYVDRGALSEGDHVRITVPTCSGYVSMLLMFVLPMALFITGAVLGTVAEPADASHGLPTILGGIAGLALAVIIAAAVNHRVTGRRNILVEAISAEEARCQRSAS
jgi:positive regulator of sigma E activity